MGYVLLFLKKYIPQKQTKKVFKSIRDAPPFNNVSTATDYNFKATELRWLPRVFTNTLTIERESIERELEKFSL